MVPKYRGIGAVPPRLRRSGTARAWPPGAPRPTFAVAERSSPSSSAWLATPLAEDPLLQSTHRTTRRLDVEAWRGRLIGRRSRADVRPALEEYRDVLRDEVAPRHPTRRAVRAVLAPRRRADLCPAPRPRQHHDPLGRPGDPRPRPATRSPPSRRSTAPSAARSSAPTTSRRSTSALRTTPRCGTTTPPRSSPTARPRSPRPGRAMPEWFDRLPVADCEIRSTDAGRRSASTTRRADDGSPRRGLLRQHLRPERLGARRDRGAGLPRGHPRPPPPARHRRPSSPTCRPYARHTIFNAYAEGWGLYTERLADEMGLYSTPADPPRHADDGLRAGLPPRRRHRAARHWAGAASRPIDYMVANSPLSSANVTAEVNRYAVLPGQACGYMIGRLEILRIRREAQERQGERVRHQGVPRRGARRRQRAARRPRHRRARPPPLGTTSLCTDSGPSAH